MPDQHRRRTALTGSRPRRKSARSKTRYQIARVDSLAPGESLKFMLPIRGADEECFLINFGGEFHAYVNRCRHVPRSEEHTSELQSHFNLVCRLLLEKKKPSS